MTLRPFWDEAFFKFHKKEKYSHGYERKTSGAGGQRQREN